MLNFLFAAVLLLGAADPQLVGAWSLNGQPSSVLEAGGGGTLGGKPLKWSTKGGVLTMVSEGTTTSVPYTVDGDNLVISVYGFPVAYQRTSKGGKATKEAAAAAAAPAPAIAKPAGNDEISKLLLSSPWCTFSFNKTTGYSSSTRYQFFENGTIQVGGQSEGYSSGYGGSMASQSNSSSTIRWEVRKGQLFLASPESNGQFVAAPFEHYKNSSGYPILKANGTEYSQCK